MSNDYYNSGSFPATGSAATSASMRAELALIAAGFDKLPTITGNADKFVLVNSAGTGLTATSAPPAITLTDSTFVVQDNVDTTKKFRFEASSVSTATTRVLTVPDADLVLVGTTTTQTLTNKTLTSPVISTIVNTGTLTLPTSTDTLVGRATTDTLTNKTLTSPVISTIVNTGTLTLPTTTDTLVGRATTDTLTNKTLASPTISSINNGGTLTLPTGPDTLVSLAATQTLTNKTLTTPTISSINNGGTLTLPTGPDTLVSLAATQTLTNKTLTSPTISGGSINNATVGATTASTGAFTTLAASGAVTLSGGTANGVPYLNGSKVLTSGSALVFNGSNLGVNVSPSSWGAGVRAVEINTAGNAIMGGSANLQIFSNAYFDGTDYRYSASAAAALEVIDRGYFSWYGASSGTAGNVATMNPLMRLSAAGSLLVGTTSAAWSGTSYREITVTSSGTSNTMTIGCGSTTSAYAACIYPNDGGVIFDNTSSARDYLFVKASNTVYATVTAVINNVSDYRLKENVEPLSGALARIERLKPVRYSMKADVKPAMPWGTAVVDGFLAHEYGEVVPGGVYGEKDAVNDDGSIKPQQIDMTRVIPLMVAAIQDQSKLIADLMTRITQLEAG